MNATVTLGEELRGRAWWAANMGADEEHDRLAAAADAVESEADPVVRHRLYADAVGMTVEADR